VTSCASPCSLKFPIAYQPGQAKRRVATKVYVWKVFAGNQRVCVPYGWYREQEEGQESKIIITLYGSFYVPSDGSWIVMWVWVNSNVVDPHCFQCGSEPGSREPNQCGSMRIRILVRLFRPWMKEEKGIRHRGEGAYLRCPVSTSVQFSLHNEGSSEYICVCEGRESLRPNF
jgi:hypothetical protein